LLSPEKNQLISKVSIHPKVSQVIILRYRFYDCGRNHTAS
jgi:hypothetical protein